MTGGGAFGGGFFGSSFCAETASDIAVRNAKANNICRKTFIGFIFLSFVRINASRGKRESASAFLIGNHNATDAVMTQNARN